MTLPDNDLPDNDLQTLIRPVMVGDSCAPRCRDEELGECAGRAYGWRTPGGVACEAHAAPYRAAYEARQRERHERARIEEAREREKRERRIRAKLRREERVAAAKKAARRYPLPPKFVPWIVGEA